MLRAEHCKSGLQMYLYNCAAMLQSDEQTAARVRVLLYANSHNILVVDHVLGHSDTPTRKSNPYPTSNPNERHHTTVSEIPTITGIHGPTICHLVGVFVSTYHNFVLICPAGSDTFFCRCYLTPLPNFQVPLRKCADHVASKRFRWIGIPKDLVSEL